jgi:hypothetical protein
MSKLIVEMSAVKLTVVRDELEAEALCGLLRTNGIACFYRKTDSAGAIGAESGGFAIAVRRRFSYPTATWTRHASCFRVRSVSFGVVREPPCAVGDVLRRDAQERWNSLEQRA